MQYTAPHRNMYWFRIFFLTWLGLGIAGPTAFARSYVYEGFNYEVGKMGGLEGGGDGLVPVWNQGFGQTDGFQYYHIRTGSLVGMGSIDSRRLERPGASKGVTSFITRELAAPIGAIGTTRYLGFLLKTPDVGGLPPLWATGIHMGIRLHGPDFNASVFAGIINGGPKFFLTKYVGTAGETGGPVVQWGTTYTCVLKMEFQETGTVCSLYLNSTEADAPIVSITIGPGVLRHLEIASNHSFAIDEIRISDTYEELRVLAPQSQPVMTVANATVTEGNTGSTDATVRVSLSKISPYDVYADFQDHTGSADASDYITQRGRVHFAPGEREKSVIMQVNGDTQLEPNESFTVSVRNLIGAERDPFNPLFATVNIINDDVEIVKPTLAIGRTLQGLEIQWPRNGSGFVLQRSMDLVTWSDIEPPVVSDEQGVYPLAPSVEGEFFRMIRR